MCSRVQASGSASSVVRQIDDELQRLNQCERAVATERELLLSARRALTSDIVSGPVRPRRLSQDDVAAYLAAHPRSSPSQIAEALDVPATNVSTHLYRGRHTRYERREDGWHLRSAERDITAR
jgi:hypothetical protein